MNTRGIEALLSKYYEGTTTLQEEEILRDFFRDTPDIPDDLKPHQEMFAVFNCERRQEMNDPDFDQRLTMHLTTEDKESPAIIPVKTNISRFLYLASIAASILIMGGLFFTYKQEVFRSGKSYQIPANQELAFTEANEALLIVSSNLNAGLRQAEHLQMVDKAMKNLQLFNRFYQCQTIIINPDEIQQKSINSK